MKQEDAETMARFALARGLKSFSDEDVLNLCRHIVGDMKREIENAAFERAASVKAIGSLHPSDRASVRHAIRALIQPPAQKGDISNVTRT